MKKILFLGTLLIIAAFPLKTEAADNANTIMGFTEDAYFTDAFLTRTVVEEHKLPEDELVQKFPETLTATMKDGTTKNIKVTWNDADGYTDVVYENYAFVPKWDQAQYELDESLSDWDVPSIDLIVNDESKYTELKKYTIKMLDDSTLELEASPVIFVKELKQKIADAKGIAVEEQHLYYNNVELDNEKRLQDYRIWELQNNLQLQKTEPDIKPDPEPQPQPEININLKYCAHVQDYGWMNDQVNGAVAGTVGASKRMEALVINCSDPSYNNQISVQAHVQDYGWMNWVSGSKAAGTVGQSKRVEAFRIRLSGRLAEKYDIYYRAHIQDYGWLDWAKNGANAGSEGMSKRMEAIQIVVVPKGSLAPGSCATPFVR